MSCIHKMPNCSLQAEHNLRQLSESGYWQYEQARLNFWHSCNASFTTEKVDSELAAEFFEVCDCTCTSTHVEGLREVLTMWSCSALEYAHLISAMSLSSNNTPTQSVVHHSSDLSTPTPTSSSPPSPSNSSPHSFPPLHCSASERALLLALALKWHRETNTMTDDQMKEFEKEIWLSHIHASVEDMQKSVSNARASSFTCTMALILIYLALCDLTKPLFQLNS